MDPASFHVPSQNSAHPGTARSKEDDARKGFSTVTSTDNDGLWCVTTRRGTGHMDELKAKAARLKSLVEKMRGESIGNKVAKENSGIERATEENDDLVEKRRGESISDKLAREWFGIEGPLKEDDDLVRLSLIDKENMGEEMANAIHIARKIIDQAQTSFAFYGHLAKAGDRHKDYSSRWREYLDNREPGITRHQRALALFPTPRNLRQQQAFELLRTPAGMLVIQPEPVLDPAGKYFKYYCFKRDEVDAALRCLRDSPLECYVDYLQIIADKFMFLVKSR